MNIGFNLQRTVLADGIVIPTSGLRENHTLKHLASNQPLIIHTENTNIFLSKNNAINEARKRGWKRIWLIDDDIMEFFYFELNKSGRNKWFFDISQIEMPEDTVYGGTRYISMSNDIIKKEFTDSYSCSGVLYLNLELLDKIEQWPGHTRRGFEMIPGTREDLFTGMWLTEAGYKCTHANQFAHRANTNYKKSHLNADALLKLGRNSLKILNNTWPDRNMKKYERGLIYISENVLKQMKDNINHG
ncbi:MAG: hypothetical protein LBD88_03450 [Candidatus Peribacteria bacterium]|jgi:hypothetical protein|nr:hypothetical protein [Candidatus Peribacteria bacterium]